VQERFHRFEVVIHAGQQNALISKWNSGVGQSFKGFFDFNR